MTVPQILVAWFAISTLLGLVLGRAIGVADEAQRAADRAMGRPNNFKSYTHVERE